MNRCPELDELLREGGEGDAARAHAETCVRCAALLADWRRFESGAPDAPVADLVDADARLAAALEREMAREAGAGAAAAAPTVLAMPLRRDASAARRWVLPITAAAALTIVAAWMATRGDDRAPAPAPMRGEAHARDDERATAGTASGELALSWAAVPGASEYRIELMSSALQPLGTLGPFAGTHATLAREAVPGLASGDTVLVRVIALAGSRIVHRAAFLTVRVP